MSDPQDSTSTPTTEEGLVDLPGFMTTHRQTRIPDPLDPDLSTVTTPLEEEPSQPPRPWQDDDEDEAGEQLGRRSRATGESSRASTERADPAELFGLVAALLQIASLGVRFVRTRRRALPDGVWIVDEDDAQMIGAPLASIAARHSPLTGDDAGDTADALALVVGAGAYTIKNLEREREAGPLLEVVPDADDAG